MKKAIISLLMILMMIFSMTAYATEEMDEFGDITQLEDLTDIGEVIQIDNFDDYEALASDQPEISDDEYEEIYQEQMKELRKFFDEYENEKLTKVKVVKAGESEYIYEMDYTGYLYKMKKQDVTVNVLEGEYEGKEVKLTYPLIMDSLLNLNVPELKKGDIVYVSLEMDEETEEVAAYATEIGFNVERKAGVIVLGVIAIVLVVVYGKGSGIFSALLILLIITCTLLIYAEQVYLGTEIIVLAMVFAVLFIGMIVISKLGLKKDALYVAGSCILIMMLITLITLGVDGLLRNNGATLESTMLAETIIKGNIDFHFLFVGSIILILSVIIPYVACSVWEKCKETSENDFNTLLDVSKGAMTGKIEIVTAILSVLMISKLLYMYPYKYSTNEILNSDVMVTEFIRLFMCIIAITLTVPVTALMYKLVNKEVK